MSFTEKSETSKSLTQFMHFAYYLALYLKNKKVINILFIGTANDYSLLDKAIFTIFMEMKFKSYYKKSILEQKLLSGTPEAKEKLEAVVEAQDIIFVGGGNTINMLEDWKDAGLIDIFEKFFSEDRLPIMAGVSAGAMFPFQTALTDSYKNIYAPLTCMGLLTGSLCPHLDSQDPRPYHVVDTEKKALPKIQKSKKENMPPSLVRKAAFRTAVGNGDLNFPAFGVPDDCMLAIIDGKIQQAYSAVAEKDILFLKSSTKEETIKTTVLSSANVAKEAANMINTIEESAPNLPQRNTIRLYSC